MALFTSISTSTLCLSTSIRHCGPSSSSKHFSHPIIASSLSSPASPDSKSTTPNQTILSSSNDTSPNPYAGASSRPPEPPGSNYALANGNPFVRFARSAESSIERTIFDFRFWHSLLLEVPWLGCVYIMDAYKVYWTSCVKGHHTGQMVLRLVEAIDVYLAGTVMLIFGMGLYGLFISNVSHDVPSNNDRALKGSSLFGMFALKERPKWMKISSLDELKTKVGHVIVMILLVKMFERSKMVQITTGLDLLSYSVCIFLSSASLYILHNLHK
ncbi:unnamed protein product [Prunus armeniaca]|uniref:Structural constituent of ribosome n=1 Tax=Prunus armeniaca TaxID=36596 RepID=A0A6J5WNR6_PRUAR|nr:unnamed protein product [Prunus armeniaca]